MSGVRRRLVVHVVNDGDVRYLLIQGICSERTLTRVTRAVALWGAFGRYEHVLIDLGAFRDWSPRVAELLTVAVPEAGTSGVWMGFFSLDSRQYDVTELDRINVYPDRSAGTAAMGRHRSSHRSLVQTAMASHRFDRANLRALADNEWNSL